MNSDDWTEIIFWVLAVVIAAVLIVSGSCNVPDADVQRILAQEGVTVLSKAKD